MNRRLLFMVVLVLMFCIGVIIWFFIYTKPSTTPSLGDTVNPLLAKDLPPRSQFINKDGDDALVPPSSTSTTEVTKYTPQPLTNIWKEPTTGQTFVTVERLDQITSTTTVGTTTVISQKFVQATGTILMFVDRITGHIYGYNRETNKTYQISNTTLPGIYDAYIFNNGRNVIFRYEDENKSAIVATYATIPQVKQDSQARPLENITNLPSQVTSIAVNKKGTNVSYLVTNDNGSSVYTIEGDKKAVLIASSPLKELNLSYGGNTLYATTKPSAYLPGQTVQLPSFEYIIGDKTGLMSLPGEGGVLLNSMLSSTGLKTFISNSQNISILSIATLSSKCLWENSTVILCAVPKALSRGTEGLPDDWFQGRVSFDDTLYTVDSKLSSVTSLFSFRDYSNLPFDVIGLSVSQDTRYISFVRKQDGGLWFIDTNLLQEE